MNRATICGAGAIALWAFLALLSRAAGALPPLQQTAMAFAVSGLCGLAWLAVRGRLGVLRLPKLAWAHGVGGLFGYHALYFAALAYAPPAEANLINYTWPLLIVIFSGLLLGLRLTRWHLLGTLLGVAGCAILLAGGASLSRGALPGYLLAAAAAVTWALYSVLARRMQSVPTEAVAGFCAAAAVLAAVAHFLFEPTILPDAAALGAALVLGIGPVGAAFFLWDFGMKRGDPRLLGTLAYATPVASTLLLCAAGFAPFTLATLAAAGLVTAGGMAAARG